MRVANPPVTDITARDSLTLGGAKPVSLSQLPAAFAPPSAKSTPLVQPNWKLTCIYAKLCAPEEEIPFQAHTRK